MGFHPFTDGVFLRPFRVVDGTHQGADVLVLQVDVADDGCGVGMVVAEAPPRYAVYLFRFAIDVLGVLEELQVKAVELPVRCPARHDNPLPLVDGLLQQGSHGWSAGVEQLVVQSVVGECRLAAAHQSRPGINADDFPSEAFLVCIQLFQGVDGDVRRYDQPDACTVVHLSEHLQPVAVFLEVVGMRDGKPAVHEHVRLPPCQCGEDGCDVGVEYFHLESLFREYFLGQMGDGDAFRPVAVSDAYLVLGQSAAGCQQQAGAQHDSPDESFFHNSFCLLEVLQVLALPFDKASVKKPTGRKPSRSGPLSTVPPDALRDAVEHDGKDDDGNAALKA